MRTLKDLKADIEKIERENPEWMNLPLIYAKDEEGNDYHKIECDLTPMQMDDMNEYYLELVGSYMHNSDDITKEDVNCICIN
jgi:hypothetical protein